MSAFVRTARIVFSVAVCCSAAFTDMHPSRSSPAAESQSSSAIELRGLSEKMSLEAPLPRLALLTPELPGLYKNPAPSVPVEPFNMPANAALPEEIVSKWSDLQSRILADEKTIAACRLDEATCSPAARRFLSLVESGGKNEPRVQLGKINRAINLAIRPASDWAQYGYADFWASPLQTLASGAGDCEDYAIVKYVVLRALGMTETDLRLMIVRDDKHQVEHAVVAVRDEQEWLILDNRTMFIVNAADASYYNPMFVLEQKAPQAFASAVNPVTDR
jgi:predicted transglutaminase-like cysteine proteinase